MTHMLTNPEILETVKDLVASEETVCVALLDLDGFHAVNQQLGRVTGDRVLETVGAALQEAAAQHGWRVGRKGGDEFAVAMPGVALEKGFLQLEEFRRTVEAQLEGATGDLAVTVSVGVANFPRDAKDDQSLLQKADQALWQAKEAGRNQVALPSPEEMVLRSCYYSTSQLGRLKRLAEQLKKKEAVLLREALDDLLRKYDRPS